MEAAIPLLPTGKPQRAISIVIPTLNAADTLPATLATATELQAAGLLAQVVIADGGSSDGTRAMAVEHGAVVIEARRGRGTQLAAGAAASTAPWLLFLHADTTLTPGWVDEVARFIGASGEQRDQAAVFRLQMDDPSPAARRLDRLVAWRTRALGLPYGDQGLLIPAALYRSVGGYVDVPLMEDVDLVRRLGRGRLVLLQSGAVTSAVRYRKDGFLLRAARNMVLLALHLCGVSPVWLVKLYD